MSRLISLRYAGKCHDCGAELPIGSTARYYGHGIVYGLMCHAKPDANQLLRKASVTSDIPDLLTRADAAAKAAYDAYVSEHYKQPSMAVVEHTNPLDDSSPIKKVYPINDLCGFVWMGFHKDRGRNKELVSFFKKHGRIGNFKALVVEIKGIEFRLKHSDYKGDFPWLLDAQSVGYGNCAFGAACASGHAFCNVMREAGFEVYSNSRLD